MSLSDDIAEAKRRLSLPDFLIAIGDGAFAKKNTRSPFRNGDNNTCFGIFKKGDGEWNWKDQVTGQFGDEIDYLMERRGIEKEEAQRQYLEIAGVQRDQSPPASNGTNKFQQAMSTSAKSLPPFDWPACVEAMTDHVEGVAKWRGLSTEFLEAYRQFGGIGVFTPTIAGSKPCVAFPVENGGKVVGCHYRLNRETAEAFTEFYRGKPGKERTYEEGSWQYTAGCRLAPIVIGDLKSAADKFIFESQWDGLALMDVCGWHEGRMDEIAIAITRGAGNGRHLEGMLGDTGRAVLFKQNDKVDQKTGKIAADEWAKAIIGIAKVPVFVAATPLEHKDINDWAKAGATDSDLWNAVSRARDVELDGITVTAFKELLKFNPKADPNCILGNRWICRTGSALWIGQSGIGKSSLMVQAAIMWALEQALFGIKPVKSLRSLIIQAENDEGDIAEMIQGVIRALEEQYPNSIGDIVEILEKQLIFVRDTIHTSQDFAKVTAKLVKRYQPDLVWGDPLLSYAGDDISQQKVASTFLRNYLNPVAFDTGIAWMMLHHTGKPNSDAKARGHWKENDHSYVGLGSSELTNWARAVNVLATTAHDGVFRLMLPKRGSRAGMRDLDGNAANSVFLEQAEYPNIYWNQVTEPAGAPQEASGPNKGRFSQKYKFEDVLKEMSAITPMKASEVQEKCHEELGISKVSFYRLWNVIKAKSLIKISEGGWVKS